METLVPNSATQKKHYKIILKNKFMSEKMKSHILNLYLLALSDGDFAPEELEAILMIAEEKGFSKEEKGFSKEDFQKIISNPVGIDFHLPENFMDRIKLLFDFVKVILADGVVKEDEKKMFYKFCEKFEFEEGATVELFDWLVEISKQNLSTDEINSAIEKLIQE